MFGVVYVVGSLSWRFGLLDYADCSSPGGGKKSGVALGSCAKNLGDEVQSLAVAQLLPWVDGFVDLEDANPLRAQTPSYCRPPTVLRILPKVMRVLPKVLPILPKVLPILRKVLPILPKVLHVLPKIFDALP